MEEFETEYKWAATQRAQDGYVVFPVRYWLRPHSGKLPVLFGENFDYGVEPPAMSISSLGQPNPETSHWPLSFKRTPRHNAFGVRAPTKEDLEAFIVVHPLGRMATRMIDASHLKAEPTDGKSFVVFGVEEVGGVSQRNL